MRMIDRFTIEKILECGKLHEDLIKPEYLHLFREGVKVGWIKRSRAGYMTLRKGR